MKKDHYTSIPSWPISLEELVSLLNRNADEAALAEHLPNGIAAFTLDCIAQQAPWFDPAELEMDRAVHPMFRNEDDLPE